MNERIQELLLAKLREDIETKAQRRLKHRCDFIGFAETLSEVTGQHLSDTTLRRFWGYQEQGVHATTTRTLDILSIFLGYTNWEDYLTQNREEVRRVLADTEGISPEIDEQELEAPEAAAESEPTDTEQPATPQCPEATDVERLTTGKKPRKRKWLAIGAAACIAAIATLVYAQGRDFETDGITYHVESYVEGRAKIAASADDIEGSIKLPEMVDNIGRTYSVVAVDDDAFYLRNNITEIYLPATIERIGKRAFKCCDKLESVQMGDNVIEMGDEVFRSCPMLKDVRLSAALRGLPEYCFSGDSVALRNIVLPDSIHTIGRDAFGKCKELELIHMPIALEHLERGAFWECRKLKHLTLPARVKSIGSAQFWYCDSLESITILCPTLPSRVGLFEKDKQKRIILRVPHELLALYSKSAQWSEFDIEEMH